MSETRYFRSDTLLALAPWIIATAACVLVFVLLSQFVDTLHGQMQRGQALRAGQSTSVASQSPGAERPIADDRTSLAGLQP